MEIKDLIVQWAKYKGNLFKHVQSVHKKVGSLQNFSGHFVAQSHRTAHFMEVSSVNDKFENTGLRGHFRHRTKIRHFHLIK